MTPASLVPPKQTRSRETQARIERAARAMLREMSWTELTMTALARSARTSTGSIYARFPNKAALLDHLDECYCQEVLAIAERLESAATGPVAMLHELIEVVARYCRDNAGLMRTLILESRTTGNPSFESRSRRMNQALSRLTTRLHELMREAGLQIERNRVEWTLFWVLSSLRELMLFPQGVPRPRAGFQRQVREVAVMAERYLELES